MIVEKTNFTYLATVVAHSLPGPNTNMEKWKDWNSYPCTVDLSDCAAETPEGNDRFNAVQLCKLTRFVQRKELPPLAERRGDLQLVLVFIPHIHQAINFLIQGVHPLLLQFCWAVQNH